MLRSLCADLGYGTKMSPAVTAATIEALCRHVLDDMDSYSVELKDPDRAWQAYRMTEHAAVRISCNRHFAFSDSFRSIRPRWHADTGNAGLA